MIFLYFHQENQSFVRYNLDFAKKIGYKHDILLKKDAKPNQEVKFVRYNREFVVTVIVITEFDSNYLKIALETDLCLNLLEIKGKNYQKFVNGQNCHLIHSTQQQIHWI